MTFTANPDAVPQHVAVWRACRDWITYRSAGAMTAAEIAVAAWRIDPDRFGLAGYEQQFPDSNKVATLIHGRKGMVKRGYLVKVEPGVYRLGVDPTATPAPVPAPITEQDHDAAEKIAVAARIQLIKEAADRQRNRTPSAINGKPINAHEAKTMRIVGESWPGKSKIIQAAKGSSYAE